MKRLIYAEHYLSGFNAASANGKTGVMIDFTEYNIKLGYLAQGANKVKLIEEIPFDAKNITCTTTEPETGKPFEGSFTIPEVSPYLNYTVIFIKKGKQFNERSNWTCTINATAKDTATTVANKIAKYVNDNKSELGLTAGTSDSSTINLNGSEYGIDYNIILSDELSNETVNINNALQPRGSFEYIKDLIAKCAADEGFEYTAEDALELYPGLNKDLDPNKQYVIINVRFTEPRRVGTREESIYQTLHIVVPETGDYDMIVNMITRRH